MNDIRVEFRSPVEYALAQYNSYNDVYGYPIVRTNLVPAFRGENKVQMMRKMQASFSWDWGPSYPSSGIWLVFIWSSGNLCRRFSGGETGSINISQFF